MTTKATIDDALRVTWWYRAHIKVPRTSIKILATEAGCTEADVEAGIIEAKRLLDLVQPMLDAGILQQDEDGRLRIVKQPSMN